jgi:hypothetical protein
VDFVDHVNEFVDDPRWKYAQLGDRWERRFPHCEIVLVTVPPYGMPNLSENSLVPRVERAFSLPVGALTEATIPTEAMNKSLDHGQTLILRDFLRLFPRSGSSNRNWLAVRDSAYYAIRAKVPSGAPGRAPITESVYQALRRQSDLMIDGLSIRDWRVEGRLEDLRLPERLPAGSNSGKIRVEDIVETLGHFAGLLSPFLAIDDPA